MSPSVRIRQRAGKTGRSYHVYYRMGGRAYKELFAGAFQTLKDAKVREAFLRSEIAAGRDPRDTLAMLGREDRPVRTLTSLRLEYAGRPDIAESTRADQGRKLEQLVGMLGAFRSPEDVSPADIRELIEKLSRGRRPSTVRNYMAILQGMFEYGEVEPNPCRHRTVRLPRLEREIPRPPSRRQFDAMLEHVPDWWRLFLQTLEQTGMRVGELVQLCWGDVDVTDSQFRIPRGKTHAARRWVNVPVDLMYEISFTCPLELRTATGRVFPDKTEKACGAVMRRACTRAGIPHFHPHDLRSRYISLQLKRGVPITNITAQVGHEGRKLTLDTYGYVLLDEDDV